MTCFHLSLSRWGLFLLGQKPLVDLLTGRQAIEPEPLSLASTKRSLPKGPLQTQFPKSIGADWTMKRTHTRNGKSRHKVMPLSPNEILPATQQWETPLSPSSSWYPWQKGLLNLEYQLQRPFAVDSSFTCKHCSYYTYNIMWLYNV